MFDFLDLVVLLLGASFQIVNIPIQSTIPLHTGTREYCFEFLTNIGLFTTMKVLVQITRQLIRGKDQGV